jgi:hypothetical protein
VHLPGQRRQRSLHTDYDGIAILKGLPSGTTCVTAIGKNNLTAGLCLAVAASSSNGVSSFQIALAARPSGFLSPQDKIDEVEQSLPAARIRSLKGTVLDASGAVIPGAEIQVYKRGSYPETRVKALKATAEGRFVVSLEPGVYTVIFRMKPGFRSEFLGIEVALDGAETELRQTLQVGSTCDW